MSSETVRFRSVSRAARLILGSGSAFLLIGAAEAEIRIAVALQSDVGMDASGRVLVFAEPATSENMTSDTVDVARGRSVSVAAREVPSFGPRRSVTIDTQATVFPRSFATLAPGTYRVQAVLDRNGDYNFAAGGLVTSYPRSSPCNFHSHRCRSSSSITRCRRRRTSST